MNDKNYSILHRFPEKRHIIESLMAEDSEFVAICEDYTDCMKAFQYWACSEEPEAQTRVNEYGELIEALEEEILQDIAEGESRHQD